MKKYLILFKSIQVFLLVVISGLIAISSLLYSRFNTSDLMSPFVREELLLIKEIEQTKGQTVFQTDLHCLKPGHGQQALIIRLSGVIELNAEDPEVLKIKDSKKQIRLVMNEQRQFILYLDDNSNATNTTGYELTPPIEEFTMNQESNFKNSTKIDLEILISKIFVGRSEKLLLQTTVTKPYSWKMSKTASNPFLTSGFCISSGSIGSDLVITSLKSQIQIANVSIKPSSPLLNLQLHAVTLISTFICILSIGKLKLKSKLYRS